jgi:hypothetical protein
MTTTLKLVWHPFALKFPLMEGDQAERFKASLRHTDGNEVRIVYRKLPDGTFQGIDGRNREYFCIEQGLDAKYQELTIPDEDVKLFIIQRNLDRRHLTPEFRRDLVAELRLDGMSERKISEVTGIPKSTVHRDLESAPNGAVDITGSNDKTYSASRPMPDWLCERCRRIGSPSCPSCKNRLEQEKAKRSSMRPPNGDGHHAKMPPPAEPEEPTDDIEITPTDAEGSPIPDHVLPAFATAKDLTALCRDIDKLIHRAEELARTNGGRLIRIDSFRQQMKDAKGNLWANRATHICPYCKGKPPANGAQPCPCCKGEGWTALHVWSQAPGNHKAKK